MSHTLLKDLAERTRGLARGCAAAVDVLDDEEQAARRALEFLAGGELLTYTVPERDGGARVEGLCNSDEVSVRVLCTLRRELSWASGMLDVMCVMQGLGSYALARSGSEEQRAHWLPRVADGRAIAGFALTEPGAGSSLADVATRAERTESGWRLSGHKTYISNAPIADLLTILVRTSGEPGDADGLSMFLLPGGTRGIEVQPFQVIAPHPIGEVLLHDVTLPEDNLLGEEGQGLALALEVLGRFRTSVAAAACGFARRALEESVRHLEERHQFGRPLSSFQGLRFDLAEMDTRLAAAELLVEQAAEAVDEGRDATRLVARAKLFATEAAGWICDRAVQHLGGKGVRQGEIVERLYRDVRALRIYEGTSEVQKLILAKELLGVMRKTGSSE